MEKKGKSIERLADKCNELVIKDKYIESLWDGCEELVFKAKLLERLVDEYLELLNDLLSLRRKERQKLIASLSPEAHEFLRKLVEMLSASIAEAEKRKYSSDGVLNLLP